MASLSKTALSCMVGLILGLACGSGDSDGSEPVDQTQVCVDYLACASALSPDTAMALDDAYGPDGTCWASQATADDCTMTCEAQLAMLQQDNPGEPACAGGAADGSSSG